MVINGISVNKVFANDDGSDELTYGVETVVQGNKSTEWFKHQADQENEYTQVILEIKRGQWQ